MITQEVSAKKTLLRTLMNCPHRKLEETKPTFSSAFQADPFFAGKVSYALTLDRYNKIRDLGEAGISFLLASEFAEHREAGRICLQSLEPYRVARVGKFIRENLKANRQVKGAVEDYLRYLEKNKARFDGAAKVAGKGLHRLYELYHISPSSRAQTILFENKVPEGEENVIKLLMEASTPEDQAEIIIKYRIPYRQATSVLKAVTPAVWVALIEVMSPAEAVNSRASIERSGILEDKDIRKLYEDKLKKASTDKRVATSTLTERKSAKGKDTRLDEIISTTAQTKIDSGARISLDTIVAVDVSGSMHEAIEVAKAICPQIAALCDGIFDVYCFNDTAWKLKYDGTSLKDFTEAFKMIRANGSTSLGSALHLAVKSGFIPEQVLFITDQGENHPPKLLDVFKRETPDTRFVFINIGGIHELVRSLESAGAEVAEFDITTSVKSQGWYAVIDNFVPLLTKGGYLQLVEEIMTLDLPKRN